MAGAVGGRDEENQDVAVAEDGTGADQAASGSLFEKQKQVLQQRVSTIEQLQRDRTGGQELLDEVANTVSRAENLVADHHDQEGVGVNLEGAAASINSVANFITALKTFRLLPEDRN